MDYLSLGLVSACILFDTYSYSYSYFIFSTILPGLTISITSSFIIFKINNWIKKRQKSEMLYFLNYEWNYWIKTILSNYIFIGNCSNWSEIDVWKSWAGVLNWWKGVKLRWLEQKNVPIKISKSASEIFHHPPQITKQKTTMGNMRTSKKPWPASMLMLCDLNKKIIFFWNLIYLNVMHISEHNGTQSNYVEEENMLWTCRVVSSMKLKSINCFMYCEKLKFKNIIKKKRKLFRETIVLKLTVKIMRFLIRRRKLLKLNNPHGKRNGGSCSVFWFQTHFSRFCFIVSILEWKIWINWAPSYKLLGFLFLLHISLAVFLVLPILPCTLFIKTL